MKISLNKMRISLENIFTCLRQLEIYWKNIFNCFRHNFCGTLFLNVYWKNVWEYFLMFMVHENVWKKSLWLFATKKFYDAITNTCELMVMFAEFSWLLFSLFTLRNFVVYVVCIFYFLSLKIFMKLNKRKKNWSYLFMEMEEEEVPPPFIKEFLFYVSHKKKYN